MFKSALAHSQMPALRLPRPALLLALMLAFAPPATAQVVPPAPQSLPTPLTLSQAIAIALSHQPDQFIARDQQTQAQGQKLQAQSRYYPALTPSYQYQNNRQNFYGLNSGGSTVITTPGTTTTGGGTGTGTTGTGMGSGGTVVDPGGTGATGTGSTGTGSTGTTGTGTSTVTQSTSVNEVSVVRGGGLTVGVSQNLFDDGTRETVNTQARRAVDAANFNTLNTRQNTVLVVTQNYYQLLLATDLVKVARAQVARFQQAVDVTQAQITAGTAPAKDVYQARSDLATAQVTLLQNQNQVLLASASLKNALGVASTAPVQAAPLAAGDALPPPPPVGKAVTFEQALAAAFTQRPDLRQQEAIVQSQNAAVRLARRQAGLTLRGDYVLTYQATNDTGARGTDSQFLVTGSYPLFDAGSARGAVRIAQAQRDVAANQLEQVRQQIRLDVEQSYNTRAVNQQAAGLAQAAVTAAQVNYDAAVAARQEGIGTVLDITTAQATLTQAESQYVTAVYNFYIADAQLQRALGQNDSAVPAVQP